MANTSIFESDIFTFKIGPDETLFRIHKRAVENNSSVLAAMINNGNMKESITGIAVLEDIEPETFRLAMDFMYSGAYRIEPNDDSPQSPTEKRSYFEIVRIKDDSMSMVGTFSLSSSTLRNLKVGGDVRTTYVDNVSWIDTYMEIPDIKMSTQEASFYKRSYPVLGQSHKDFAHQLRATHPPDNVTAKVSRHAKLFIFAQVYMIESLAELCLHKLHRDLQTIRPAANNVYELVALFTYTYANTSDPTDNQGNEDISTASDSYTSNSALRQLVMAFALIHAERLSALPEFQSMLRAGGRFVSDFITGVFLNKSNK